MRVRYRSYFRSNRYGLKLWITFDISSLKYSNEDWKKSKVPASILSPMKNHYSIVMTMQQVYKSYETVKYLDSKMK